ncbi:MAG: DUF2059 domain-containing protein [Rhodoplanes sp.]
MQVGWLARIAVAATLACGSLLMSGPVAAQQQPTPAAVTAAGELLALKGGDVVFTPIVSGVVETVKNVFVPTNPNLGNELNEVATKLRKDYESKRVELLNEVARVYAERFSEQELKALVAFYKSPLGRKMAMEEPAIIDESMRRAQTWGDALSGEVMSRFREEMKKKGHDL